MTFSQYRLLPMGSHPRIADSKGTHDLFGPVNRFLCINYDRAVVCFLACLKVGVRGRVLSQLTSLLRGSVERMPESPPSGRRNSRTLLGPGTLRRASGKFLSCRMPLTATRSAFSAASACSLLITTLIAHGTSRPALLQVGGLTIKLTLNKETRWTKALKYMLVDLKWSLKYVISQQDGALAASLSALPRSLAPSVTSSSVAIGF